MNKPSKFSRMHLWPLAAAAGFSLYLVFGALRPSVFAAAETSKPPYKVTQPAKNQEVATFAAGCFWSMEAIFKQLKGVERVEPGYAGGKVKNPTYEQVETSTTGHAESINIIYDPKVISYRDLLDVLFTVRNPTTKNKQGPDEGPQYRFVVFPRNAAQKKATQETIQRFTAKKVWSAPIIAEVVPFKTFYRAEDYHLDYYNLHPQQGYCAGVIGPEIEEFHAKFKSKLK